MSIVELSHVVKRFGKGKKAAVNNVSFCVEKGEILALVGESGSGKTTLLRLIAGLEHPNSGSIKINDTIVVSGHKSVPANKRKTGMVFQDYALFPHLTIFDNVAFGLKDLKKSELKDRVNETLQMTGLDEDTDKYPHQLSGGQQQRVALARALAPRPEVLLLDEPFSNLDTILRDRVREEVRQIIKNMGITAILVTHDTKDAFSTADKIAVMLHGELLQIDTPDELYNEPSSAYVANLFGKANSVEAVVEPDGFRTPFGVVSIPANCPKCHKDRVNLFFRAEETEFCNSTVPHLCGRVEQCIYLGNHIQLKVSCRDCDLCGIDNQSSIEGHSVILTSTNHHYKPGDMVRFRLKNFKIKETPEFS